MDLDFTGTLMEALGIEVKEAAPDRVVLAMPVGPATRQPAGFLHGGASAALAETAASLGTLLNIDRGREAAAGMEISASHLRPVSAGSVTATAVPLHRGRTSMVWDIRIADERGRLVCVSRCTVAVVPADRFRPS